MSKKAQSKSKFENREKTTIFISKIPSDRRGEWRLNLPLPVEVEGELPKGKKFKENTFIKNISSGGAYISLDSAITVGSKLTLTIELPPSLTEEKKVKLSISGYTVRLKKSEKSNKKQDVALSFDENYQFIQDEGQNSK